MNDLMTELEVACWLRRRVGTLRNWRTRREGPPFIKEGASVVYARADVAEWLASRRVGGGTRLCS